MQKVSQDRPQRRLTGTRIRERREIRGVRQAELARTVGISPSYLNLIEHNRRRIGGKLLVDIAGALEVEPSLLAEGAEAALVARLRAAAAHEGEEGAELAEAEGFAGRYPGWARLVAAQAQRVEALERAVETLTDRLAHDPHLAATLHEVLDTATAIRSTASILAEAREIEPEWRDRFHRNINEDAERLAEGARSLAGFLDRAERPERAMASPEESFEAWLGAQGWHVAALEAGATPEDIVAGAPELGSDPARVPALAWLRRVAADAAAMPLGEIEAAVAEAGMDPLAVAARFGGDIAAAMRRLALLPGRAAGLVVCDGSGTITFRRTVDGFSLPRFGAACPLWPLYRALSRPHLPLFERLVQPGRGGAGERVFGAFAVAQPAAPAGLNRDPLYEATMLILPDAAGAGVATPVGASCRVCAVPACSARREPSIMAEAM